MLLCCTSVASECIYRIRGVLSPSEFCFTPLRHRSKELRGRGAPPAVVLYYHAACLCCCWCCEDIRVRPGLSVDADFFHVFICSHAATGPLSSQQAKHVVRATVPSACIIQPPLTGSGHILLLCGNNDVRQQTNKTTHINGMGYDAEKYKVPISSWYDMTVVQVLSYHQMDVPFVARITLPPTYLPTYLSPTVCSASLGPLLCFVLA